MVKIGRPKDYTKKNNRRHGVLLNENAEVVLREVKKKRPDFNLSRYVTEHLIRDFEDPIQREKREIIEIQKQVDALHRKMREKSDKIKELQDQKAKKMVED